MATSDFSGFVSSAWALAKAPARAATDSLERGIGHLHEVKADRSGLGALRPDAVADRFFGLVRHQSLELGLGAFMIEERRPSAAEQRSKVRPGVRRAHIDDLDRLNARPRRLSVKQGRGLTAADSAP